MVNQADTVHEIGHARCGGHSPDAVWTIERAQRARSRSRVLSAAMVPLPRCLVIIDLKVGKSTHANAGQARLYLNYAREHWTLPEENPPVGLRQHDGEV